MPESRKPPFNRRQAHQNQAFLAALRRTGDAREAAMYEADQQRAREAFDIAEAERRAAGEPSPFGPKLLPLPALDQVTGWSKAGPVKRPPDRERPMFGGWRVGEWEGD